MTRPLLFGVYGHDTNGMAEPLATFFASSDAETFAMHIERDGFEKRNAYCAVPRYDKRAGGYRPAEKASGFAEWRREMDARKAQRERRRAA